MNKVHRFYFIFVVIGCFGNQAFAACVMAQWPYSRSQTNEEYFKLFRDSKRDSLVAYLMNEATQSKKEVFPFLLKNYLSLTEQNPDKKAFYDLIQWGAEFSEDGKKESRVLKRDEICKYYSFAFESKKTASLSPEKGKKR